MTPRTRALLAAPALCAALALSLAACGTKDEPSSGGGGSTGGGSTSQGTTVTTGKTTATTAKTTGTTTKATGTSTPSGPVAIKTATTSIGEVLVDGEGMTLYVFEKDTPAAIACVDACTTAWPPLVGTSAEPGTGVTATSFATVTRPDGKTQITVDGKPLYRFSGDTKPGDTNGQKLNDVWYAVNPAGQPIE